MVHIKRKVTIRQKQSVSKTDSTNAPFPPKKRLGIITAGIIVVIGIVGYLLFNTNSSSEDETTIAQTDASRRDSTSNKVEKAEENATSAADTTIEKNQTEAPESESNSSDSQENAGAAEKEQSLTASASTDPTTPGITSGGSVEEEATLVIRGVYGNGEERKQKLGAKYPEIQNKVNEMYRDGLVD